MAAQQQAMVAVVVIREYDAKKDCHAVETVERRCESGPSGKLCLYTDHLGDPLCRIRHSPSHLMLVAELVLVGDEKEKREIVGMIRGCIKTVTCGTVKSGSDERVPIYTKLAYILGLRVSPSHRRMGIAENLVRKMEKWFTDSGAEYSYMATEKDNLASLNLFTGKCGYKEFRTPAILVQPVFAHRVRVPRRVAVIRLSPHDAETLYRRRFSSSEFFPGDIDAVLNNRLNIGTFVAVPAGSYAAATWPGSDGFLDRPPESWAVLSVWNGKEVFNLEVRGASRLRKALTGMTRVVDRALPFLRLPSVPDFFRPFGFHFLYGLGGEGPEAASMMKSLAGFAHNLAVDSGCAVVATEVAGTDPLRRGIPHWKRFSCDEDMWCIKRLREAHPYFDWTKSLGGEPIFVDPREI